MLVIFTELRYILDVCSQGSQRSRLAPPTCELSLVELCVGESEIDEVVLAEGVNDLVVDGC